MEFYKSSGPFSSNVELYKEKYFRCRNNAKEFVKKELGITNIGWVNYIPLKEGYHSIRTDNFLCLYSDDEIDYNFWIYIKEIPLEDS